MKVSKHNTNFGKKNYKLVKFIKLVNNSIIIPIQIFLKYNILSLITNKKNIHNNKFYSLVINNK